MIGRSLTNKYRLAIVVGPCEPGEAEAKLEALKGLLDANGFRHEALSIGWAATLNDFMPDLSEAAHNQEQP